MLDKTLQREIEGLIARKREGDYWDFKQCYHENKTSLLHDIICMSNNLADRDAYIIFGVVDKTGEVVGVENDRNRKNQQQLVDQLKDKKFASGMRPMIELVSLSIEEHTVDVLIIKNSNHTPYFLTEDYSYDEPGQSDPNKKKTVHANYIYTRICDTNTPIDMSADIDKVEYLWRKRFGIDKPILDRYKILLGTPDDWAKDLGNKDYIYTSIFQNSDWNGSLCS
jgi:predicted HTH transcriptional regulator